MTNKLIIVLIIFSMLPGLFYIYLNKKVDNPSDYLEILNRIDSTQQVILKTQEELKENGFWEAELPTKKLDSLYRNIDSRIKILEYNNNNL